MALVLMRDAVSRDRIRWTCIAENLVQQLRRQEIGRAKPGYGGKLHDVESDDLPARRQGSNEPENLVPLQAARLGRSGGGKNRRIQDIEVESQVDGPREEWADLSQELVPILTDTPRRKDGQAFELDPLPLEIAQAPNSHRDTGKALAPPGHHTCMAERRALILFTKIRVRIEMKNGYWPFAFFQGQKRSDREAVVAPHEDRHAPFVENLTDETGNEPDHPFGTRSDLIDNFGGMDPRIDRGEPELIIEELHVGGRLEEGARPAPGARSIRGRQVVGDGEEYGPGFLPGNLHPAEGPVALKGWQSTAPSSSCRQRDKSRFSLIPEGTIPRKHGLCYRSGGGRSAALGWPSAPSGSLDTPRGVG
jgi:hypothetical protein